MTRTALEHRSRRVLPSGLGPSADPDLPLTVAGPDVAWVQPLPEADPPGSPVAAGEPGLAGKVRRTSGRR
jgi:RNA polymerase sigma-70 factor (ECF subfamily)